MSDSIRKAPGLSVRAEKGLRRTAVAAVFVIAAAAAILSFNGLRNLALAADIPIQLAWIFPIVVDGLTLVGSLGVVHAVLTGIRSWYPWLLTLLGVGMSVWGNVASSPPTLVAQIVHAIPPLVLALSLEALLKVYRYRAVAGYLEESATSDEERAAIRDASEHLPLPGETPAFALPGLPSQPHPSQPDGISSARSATPPPVAPVAAMPTGAPAGATTREQLQSLLTANPDITAADAARILGRDRSNVSKILRELKDAPTNAESENN